MSLSPPTDLGWVEPPKPIRGLDHLGVQAPCIALYSQLLPGVTNVTERARYYSFYPWFIRSLDRRYSDHSPEVYCRVLRRAECLYSLIAIRHARVVGDGNEWLHGAGMVGRFRLGRIPEGGKPIHLGEYAALEGPNRYFKNRLGGLGQYYFGPLRDLRVVDHAPGMERSVPGYDKVRGAALAEAFGSGMAEDDFFRLLECEKIYWNDLDELSDFCPCALRTRGVERTHLLDLFFARSAEHQSVEATTRRSSLSLILDLLSRCEAIESYGLEDVFKASTYTGALPDGTTWDPHPSLVAPQRAWATYGRNELLSLALQAIFAAVLSAVERDDSGSLESSEAAGDVCLKLLRSSSFRFRQITDVVSELRSNLPAIHAWRHPDHELQRGRRILSGKTAGDAGDAPDRLAEEGIALLLSLLARGLDANPYAQFEFEPGHFDRNEIHLLSLERTWHSTWFAMSIEEWVRWLSVHWIIERHLSVALRKLRGQRQDTFRIRPLEHELRVVEVPAPTATVPRLGKTFQILRDVGVLDDDVDGWPFLTARGREVLEECLGT